VCFCWILPRVGWEAWWVGVLRGVASVVASAMIRGEEGLEGVKEKDRQATEERKVRFLELFMG
jgi:hypothetical protein